MNSLINIPKLVVNWHFINDCNMSCKFCFADKHQCSRRSLEDMLNVIEKLSMFNRINFVGGEPTVSPFFEAMVNKAHSLGVKLSVVTNGFYAMKRPELFDNCFSKMDKVGLSIDSLDPATNISTGRAVGNQVLSKDDALGFCRRIKELGISLKINTVVHSENLDEDFNAFLAQVQPDQWKIFQVLPVAGNQQYDHLLIHEEQFCSFIDRHSAFKDVICSETSELIRDSYIMVNADGYFMHTAPYTLQPGQKSLFENDSDVLTEFSQMNYDLAKYHSRYKAVA